MAEQRIRIVCSEDDCHESDLYVYPNKTEAREARVQWATRPYKCVRHTTPNTVLSADNPTRTHVLTAFEGARESRRYEHVWRVSADARSGSGYERGPGFQAFAKDFPPGTRLIVTARIELLEDRA